MTTKFYDEHVIRINMTCNPVDSVDDWCGAYLDRDQKFTTATRGLLLPNQPLSYGSSS